MRITLAILATFIVLDAGAQTSIDTRQTPVDKKWHLQKYSSISAGALYWGGNTASYLAAPLGLQFVRPLNNNLYAFAGASITPVFFSTTSFLSAPSHNLSGFRNGNSFSINPGIHAGLMYTNDDRTFSISGRVSLDRAYYPVQPYNAIGAFQHPAAMQIQH
jgi:hypothetical protein